VHSASAEGVVPYIHTCTEQYLLH